MIMRRFLSRCWLNRWCHWVKQINRLLAPFQLLLLLLGIWLWLLCPMIRRVIIGSKRSIFIRKVIIDSTSVKARWWWMIRQTVFKNMTKSTITAAISINTPQKLITLRTQSMQRKWMRHRLPPSSQKTQSNTKMIWTNNSIKSNKLKITMKMISTLSREKKSRTKKISMRIPTVTIRSKKVKQSSIWTMISYQAAMRMISKALIVNSQIRKDLESKIKKKSSKR